jgi:sortase (surface protein transpeptidase)
VITWQVRRHRAGRRGLRIALATLTVVALGAVAATVLLREPGPASWRLGVPPSAQLAGAAEDLTGPPTRLRIPAIGIDAALGPLHMDETGELQAPADYAQPGWYEEGTVPGETGPAVIAGHLDSQKGQAIFYRLSELRPDDLILVQRDGKWITFEVVSTGRFAKNRFPTAEVYGPTPDAQLRVITCGGNFDPVRRSYRDNVVVFAVVAG